MVENINMDRQEEANYIYSKEWLDRNCPDWVFDADEKDQENLFNAWDHYKITLKSFKRWIEENKKIISDNTEQQSKEKDRIVVMSKFSPVPFAQEILKENKFIQDKHGRFWRYDNDEGIWKDNAEKFVRTNLRNNLFGDEQQKRNYVEEVVAYIKESNYEENFKPNGDSYLIAFKNKVFNLRDERLEDFKPEHYLTNKLDIEYNEEIKECPNIDKFFSESVGEDYKEILYDLPAYCLFKEMPYQKIFFVYGPASTGKSQYMNLLEKFLGENNCCSFEPTDIQKDPYAAGQMLFKLANIGSDISYDALDNVNQTKKLSGGDTMKIRIMYKEPYPSKIYCKQIFSTNKMPEVKEKTNAWYRRIYPIAFENIVSNDKRNPYLIHQMTTKEELQGFCYKCVEKLKELKNNKFVFTWDINEKEMGNLYEDLSNPIRKYIRENYEVIKNDSSKWIYQFEFKEKINNWMKANHYPEMTNREINSYMKENFNNSNRPNLRGDGVYRVWVGINTLKSSHNPDNLTTLTTFHGFKKNLYIYRKKFQNPVKLVKVVTEIKNNEK